MRFTLLAAAIATVTLPALPALAQSDAGRDYRKIVREARQEYRDDVRDARQDRPRTAQNRDWRQYHNYDYNRYERGQQTYYADRYYRDGRHYQPRRLGSNDRIYRGGNGQYYCRRNDGTTGLIIGGLAGGLLGNALSNGRSSTLGTLLGAGVGAALGSSIARGNVRCR